MNKLFYLFAMKSPGVYRIHCKANKRNYVGSSSKDWRNRRNGHVHLLKSGKHPSRKMQEDWDRLGAGEFEFLMVCECSGDRSIELEKAAADEYKAFCPEMGYNTAPISQNRFNAGRRTGGEKVRFSRMVSPEIAQKLVELLKVDDDGLLWLEHASVKGIKSGKNYGDKTVGFKHSDRIDEYIARNHDQPGPMPMAIESAETLRLRLRVKELEAKVRDYENTYSQ